MSVTIYVKTHCPYSVRARKLLDDKGVDYELIDIAKNPERREEMIERTNGKSTVPQIFVQGRHIGGCDDLMTLDSSGELEPLLRGGDAQPSA